MKVAVSIPDPLFAAADALARRTKQSRSRLYARALSAYVASQPEDDLTQTINAVLEKVGNEPDPFLTEAARQGLKRIEW